MDRLRSFMEVVSAGSVTSAAKGGASRRSLMSRQIGELEATLGFELFHRRGKSLVLTVAGREMALLVSSFFEEFEGVVARVASNRTPLRIGGGAAVFDALVFPKIQQISKSFPGILFEFLTDQSDRLADGLKDGHLDMAILREGKGGERTLHYPCGGLEFVLVGRRDYDSKMPGWSLPRFLQAVPLTMIRGSGQFLNAFRGLCRQLEMDVVPQMLVESFTQVKELMLHGQPGGILPGRLANSLPVQDFHILADDRLGCLDRKLEVVIDARAAKVRDKLAAMAEGVAAILSDRG